MSTIICKEAQGVRKMCASVEKCVTQKKKKNYKCGKGLKHEIKNKHFDLTPKRLTKTQNSFCEPLIIFWGFIQCNAANSTLFIYKIMIIYSSVFIIRDFAFFFCVWTNETSASSQFAQLFSLTKTLQRSGS